ncbi:unnamed protein product [Cylindrotheca closterium]|uniref:Uncharacterized protein n=1 Tax=Cylindrotheca closterium TaxID=2856 RepID=A0AAD2FS96_9STRA|nr:unnamed protein product [Cylindrotheca closterium]
MSDTESSSGEICCLLESTDKLHGLKDEKKQVVDISGIIFPKFSPTQKVDNIFKALVFNTPSQNDIILGNDILIPLGIDVLPSTQTIKWLDKRILWKPDPILTKQPSKPNKESSLMMAQQAKAHCFHYNPDQELNNFIDDRID